MRTRGLFVSFVIVLLVLASHPASGFWQQFEKDGAMIEPDDPLSWSMDGREGEFMEVKYDIEVVEGDPVNVLFMTMDDFDRYEDGLDYDYITSRSKLDITEESTTFVWEGTDDYRFVIETTNGTTGNSTVDYFIEIDYIFDVAGSREVQACMVVVVLAVIGAVVGVFLYLRSRGKEPPVAAPPPGEYDPSPQNLFPPNP